MTPKQLRDAANGPWGNPVWKPCFICREKVEVQDFYDDGGAGLLVVCGPCRRKAYELADRFYPLVASD